LKVRLSIIYDIANEVLAHWVREHISSAFMHKELNSELYFRLVYFTDVFSLLNVI